MCQDHLARQQANCLDPPHKLHACSLVPLCSPQCYLLWLYLEADYDESIILALLVVRPLYWLDLRTPRDLLSFGLS